MDYYVRTKRGQTMQVLSRGLKGKCLACDVTVPDTYADSHLNVTSSAPGSAASEAAIHKTAKYVSIASTYNFVPVANRDVWNRRQ